MDFVTSDNAAALLFREGKVDYAAKLDLAELALRLVERLGESKDIAVALLREVSGVQTVGEILDSLGNFLPFESTGSHRDTLHAAPGLPDGIPDAGFAGVGHLDRAVEMIGRHVVRHRRGVDVGNNGDRSIDL